MKWIQLIILAALVGVMAMVACGDEDAEDVCDACELESLTERCEESYNFCIEENPEANQDECAAGALALCGSL